MYSVLLMMALQAGSTAPAGLFDHGCGCYACSGCSMSCTGCGGCCGGWTGCCGGYTGCCSGCCGGGHGLFGGLFHHNSCCGGCCGGWTAHHGCCGGWSSHGCCGGHVACCGGGHGLFGGLFAHKACCGCSSCFGCHGGYGCGCSTCGCGGYACGGVMAGPGAPIIQGAPALQGAPVMPGAPAAPAGDKKVETIPAAPKTEGAKEQGAADAEAKILVNLPADAKLFVDDEPTTSTAGTRTFVTPALKAGKDYFYTLKAEIERDGKTYTVAQKVTVRAGEETKATIALPVATASK